MAAEAAANPTDPVVDEVDLAELQAFLAGVGGPSAEPGGAGYSGGNHGDAPEGLLPLPPGFENGPHSNGNGTASSGGLVGETTATVKVEHDDLTADLLAATSWDELNLSKEILDGIFEMGFVKPSKIQEWTLPIALKGGSIIGQAQNGSGKTAAFALSMLVTLDLGQRYPQGLCLCPTRELATQNHDVIQKLGKFTNVELFLAVPQNERPPRNVNAHVVVGTPGKVQDLCRRRVINPGWMRMLIIDEADTMIDEDNQMGPQVVQIKNLLPSQNLQVLLFSATWPDHVERFARNMAYHPYRITVQKEDLTLNTITQCFIDVGSDPKNKAQILSDLYGAMNIGQSIIFVNTRVTAFELAKMMKDEGHAVSLIAGTQKTGPEKIDVGLRDKVMGEFRSGVTRVLIATDVLARGIDVPAVTLVVNYELPMGRNRQPECETYIHRIGRTGRFGLRGVAVNLITQGERSALDEVQAYYKCNMKQLSGDLEEMEGLLKGLR